IVLHGPDVDVAGTILFDSDAAGDALHADVARPVVSDRDVALYVDDLHRSRPILEDDDIADDFGDAEIAGAVFHTHGALHITDRDLPRSVSHLERTPDVLDLEIAGAVINLRGADVRDICGAARVFDVDGQSRGQFHRDIESGGWTS